MAVAVTVEEPVVVSVALPAAAATVVEELDDAVVAAVELPTAVAVAVTEAEALRDTVARL